MEYLKEVVALVFTNPFATKVMLNSLRWMLVVIAPRRLTMLGCCPR